MKSNLSNLIYTHSIQEPKKSVNLIEKLKFQKKKFLIKKLSKENNKKIISINNFNNRNFIRIPLYLKLIDLISIKIQNSLLFIKLNF
jgi:hypothetical protein